MSDSENFTNVVVLVSKGGEMVVRKLLEKYSHPLSFSDYLYSHQATILKTLTKQLYTSELDLLLKRNIDQMDVSLLSKLAFSLFKPNMTQDEQKHVNAIKEKRNDILHSDFLKTGKIEDSVFDATFKTISDLLILAAKEVGTITFENDMRTFVETIKLSSPLFSEVYEELRKACISNNEDKIEILHNTLTDVMPEIIVERSAIRPLTCMKDKFMVNFVRFTAAKVSETRMMTKALKFLEDTNVVTLTGRPGEGKSTTTFHLVRILSSKNVIDLDRCVMLLDPKDFKDLRSNEVDLIIVDDIFGKHNATNFAEWEHYFETLDSFVQSSRKIKLISCSKKHILNELSDKLAGIPLFSKQVELDSAELTKDEKRNILKAKLLEHSRYMNEKEIEECINQKESNAGFPMIAAQFAADDSLFASRFKYFAAPINYYLEQNLRSLDFHSLAALVVLMQSSNSVTADEFKQYASQESTNSFLVKIARSIGINEKPIILAQEFWKRFQYLDGTHVRVVGDTITFLSNTVADAMEQIWQTRSDTSLPIEEAVEVTESTFKLGTTTERNTSNRGQDNNEDNRNSESCIVRLIRTIGRKLKCFWRKIKRLWAKEKETNRRQEDVESGRRP